MDILDYFEALPPLNLIGYCPINYRDVMRSAAASVGRYLSDDDLEEMFAEYVRDYREFDRRQSWDA